MNKQKFLRLLEERKKFYQNKIAEAEKAFNDKNADLAGLSYARMKYCHCVAELDALYVLVEAAE